MIFDLKRGLELLFAPKRTLAQHRLARGELFRAISG